MTGRTDGMAAPSVPGPLIAREQRTVAAMMRLWCRHHHGTRTDLCPDCRELLDYAHARLAHCPFGETKTTCARCPVHCYKPDRREAIRVVMRWAGPRMLWRHPWLALRHLLDGRKGS